MNNTFHVIAAIACGFLFTGCGFQRSQQDAEKVVARHFQAISTNGYVSALDDYRTEFFARTPREDWGRSLEKLRNRLGDFQRYEIMRRAIRKDAGTFGSGTTVSILLRSHYSKHSAKEQFTLVKRVEENDFKILAHQIQSEGLLND